MKLNRHWAAWLSSPDYQPGNHHFIIWISRNSQAFRKARGLTANDYIPHHLKPEFTKFLEAQSATLKAAGIT